MQHPYLFFSKADAERFRAKIEADENARARYEKAVEKTEEMLTEPFVTWEEANGSETLHANFGRLNWQANRFCGSLGLRYAVEGDARCAEKLKALLLHFTSFERWYAMSYVVRKPVPWHSDLCSTGTALALARIYDLIYDAMTPEERQLLARGIFEKGVKPAFNDWVLPETRMHALDSMGHNWWSVCIAEPATALLAIREELPGVDADAMLDLADRALAAYLTYPGNRLFNKMRNFDDRGMFYESVNYDNYGTGTLLRYLWCRERYTGKNETVRAALPEGLCDALMLFSYPRNRDGEPAFAFLNFGDSDVDYNVGLMVQYAVMLGIDSAAARAAAASYGTGLWEEIAGYDFSALKGSLEALPKTAFFSSGYAVARDSWEPDATVLAVKSGYCWNHSHNDSGSFVIFHKGRPFFTDSGTCDYNSPLYHAYYCQDAAHSVLRVGGKGRRNEELYRGTKFPGAIIDHAEGTDFVFIQADSTGPMAHLCSRMYRSFLWIENRLLVILDDVYCHEADAVQFTLHFDGTYRREENAVWFDNGKATARLISHLPAMTVAEKTGHEDQKQDEDKIYLELSDERRERAHLLIHTLALDPEDHPAAFTPLTGENADGLRIEDGETVREIWFNRQADGHVMHDNSNNLIGGWDTDAYLLMITRDKREDTERVLAVCASFLRKDGKAYFSSFAKKTAEITVRV